jgi:hypothetical protein
MGHDEMLKLEGTSRARVRRLESELKKRPDDKVLRDHIKQLKVAWGLVQLPRRAAA